MRCCFCGSTAPDKMCVCFPQLMPSRSAACCACCMQHVQSLHITQQALCIPLNLHDTCLQPSIINSSQPYITSCRH